LELELGAEYEEEGAEAYGPPLLAEGLGAEYEDEGAAG